MNDTTSDDVALVIRDDVWALAAGCLLAVGGVLIILALISTVGAPAAVLGLGCALGAVWILRRPVGLVIDRRTGVVISRGLLSTRRLDIADISGVGISPSHPVLAAPGVGIEVEDRYDVVLLARSVAWAVVRRDLDEAAANREAERIHSILQIGF